MATTMSHETVSHEIDWEADVSNLLTELAETQQELLDVLSYKGRQLAGKQEFSAADADREIKLLERLHECHGRRAEMLRAAREHGKPTTSLKAIAEGFPQAETRAQFKSRFQQAEQQSKLIQHRCLTQWLVAQRTLIHLSQLLEILATGGREQPTYGTGSVSSPKGGLMDNNA